jgi:hypothetical protein
MDNQSVGWGFKHVILPKEYSDKMLCLQDYNPKSQRPVSVYNVPSCFSGSNRNFTTICGESRQGKQPDAAWKRYKRDQGPLAGYEFMFTHYLIYRKNDNVL